MRTITKKPLAIGVAAALAVGGALALGASAPASAAPFAANPTAVKEAAPDDVINVHRRRGNRAGAAFAGLALGIIGTAIAAQHYRSHYPYGYYAHPGPLYPYPYYPRRCVQTWHGLHCW